MTLILNVFFESDAFVCLSDIDRVVCSCVVSFCVFLFLVNVFDFVCDCEILFVFFVFVRLYLWLLCLALL